MRKISCLILFVGSGLLFPMASLAAENNGPPVLEGIVNVTDPNLPPHKVALLRIAPAHPGQPPSHPILREGDREGRYEIKSILPDQGKVVIVDVPSGAPLALYLTQPLTGQEPPSFQFREVELGSILDLLQTLSNQSVLAPDAIRGLKFDLITPAYHSRSQAVGTLKDVIEKKGLIVQARGEKFQFVLPSRDAEVLKSIPDPPIPGPPKSQITRPEFFPPGMMKFMSADMFQVLEVYQDLSGRTVMRPSSLVRNKISLRSQTELNRPEAIWFLDAVLRLAGVVMINESTNFVFALPPGRTNNLPHLDAKRALPSKAPAQSFPPGLIKFTDADPSQVLSIYAALTGKTVTPGKVPSGKISVRSQTALDPGEAVYLLETMFAINDLSLDRSDPEKVSINSSSETSR